MVSAGGPMTVMITSHGLLATILCACRLAKGSRRFRIPAPFIFPNHSCIAVALERQTQTRSFLACCITGSRFLV
jgi:hypothetical protein